MDSFLTPTRSSLAGTTFLMACACGVATESAKLVSHSGVGATTAGVMPVFLGLGAALVLHGLWRKLTLSGILAAVAFVVLLAAAALTPPRVMTGGAMPWSATQLAGAGFYFIAAGLLGYAFSRAFPSPRPAASGTAIGGLALATGCTCCMVTGALAGTIVTAGAPSAYLQGMPIIFWTGLTVVTAGLLKLGGVRAALWVPAGGIVVQYGPDLLQLSGNWMVLDVNFRAFASYLVTLGGVAVILRGFVVAYVRAGAPAETEQGSPRERPPLGVRPIPGSAGDD